MRTTITTALAAAAAALLVGCGDGSGAEATTAPAGAVDADGGGGADVPVRGTEDEPLALGEPAEIGHYAPDDIGAEEPISTLEVAVEEVAAASAADLVAGGLQLDDEQQESDVYYVRSRYTNTGDVPVKTPATPALETEGGQRVPSLIVIETGGDYAACPGAPERLAPGATAEGCSIVLLRRGEQFTTVSFYAGGEPLFLHWRTEG